MKNSAGIDFIEATYGFRREPIEKFLEDLLASIFGSVIQKNHFEICVCLVINRLEPLLEKLLVIEIRNNNRNFGEKRGLPTSVQVIAKALSRSREWRQLSVIDSWPPRTSFHSTV